MNYWLLGLVVLCGLGIGILSGMFGIGGGAMIVPLLNAVFQLPMTAASATSLFSIAPTSISGSLRHLRQGSVNVKMALQFGIPGALASAVSATLSGLLPDIVAMLMTVGVIAVCAYRVFREALRETLDEAGHTAESRFKTPASTALACVSVGLFAGTIAGLVGVGGGFIIVPFGIAMLGCTMKEMSAISLLAIAIIALPGIISHALQSHIQYEYGIALIIGTIPGASIGVNLISRVPEKALRLAYGCLLLFTGAMLLINRFVLS